MSDLGSRKTGIGGKGAAVRQARWESVIADDPQHQTRTIRRTADNEDSRRRNLLEVRGRDWAITNDIPTPVIYEHSADGSLLVGEHVEPLPSEGHEYVQAALAVATAISVAPAPMLGIPVSGWRAPRSTLLLRVAQLAAAGVDPVRFARTRRAAARIPSQVTVHGDFHDGNVLNLGAGAVSVLDFEHVGRGPRHADALRLITTLEIVSDAEYGLDLLLRGADRADRADIAAQLDWLALRHLADLATGPVPRHRVRSAHRRWRSARDWARDIRQTGRSQI